MKSRHAWLNKSWKGCALALALAVGLPTEALAVPPSLRVQDASRARNASRRNPSNARLRADRLSNTLRRSGRAGNRATTRFVQGAFLTEMNAMVSALESTLSTRDFDAVDALRTAASFSRAVLAAREAHPESHEQLAALEDRVERLLGNARWRARMPHNRTSVEVESNTSDAMIAALTTTDGTVGTFLTESGRVTPDWLAQRAGEGGVETMAWDSLTLAEKRTLLSQEPRLGFSYTRSNIPGIRWRPVIRNATRTNVRIAGRIVRPGDEVDVSSWLLPRFQYQSAESATNFASIEFHTLAPGSAGAMIQNTRHLGNLLDISRHLQMHQHVSAPINEGLRNGDQLEVLQLVDFYRRANVVAEMEMIMTGAELKGIEGYFNFLQASQLGRVFGSLSSASENNTFNSESGWHQKFAAVGFRQGSTYNDPSLIGFEIRAVGYLSPQFSDAMQRGLVGRNYGVSRASMQRWRARIVGSAQETHQQRMLIRAHYETNYHNRPVGELIAANVERLALTDVDRATLGRFGWNQGISYLLADWSNDIALDGRPELANQIKAAQRTAIDELVAGAEPVDVLFRFVRRSGLREAMSASIGL